MTDPPEIVWIVAGAVLLLTLVYALYRPRRVRFHACPAVLTKGEQPFYRTLKAAAPHYDVWGKVRVADIINCDAASWKAGGWRVGTWHIDFVLIDPQTGAIKLCIELDDKSHFHPKRRARDAFLNDAMRRAGVRLLRLPHRRYTQAELQALLAQTEH